VDALAERVGVGGRHLRRLFLSHLGPSPLAVAQTRRLHFAKRLIDETTLPIAQVALAAGFSSLRRFNAAMRACYGRSPSELRRISPRARPGPAFALALAYRPPLDWPALADFLAARALPGVEEVDRGRYRRTVRVGAERGWIEVAPARRRDCLLASIHLAGADTLRATADGIRRVFDLEADPAAIAAGLRADARIGRLVARSRGVRIPGAWDGFELAVRAVLGQQITVKAATTLAGRLVAAYGEELPPEQGRPAALRYLFPAPEALAASRLDRIGLPRARRATIVALARAVADGTLKLDPSAPFPETTAALRAIPGIGAWTAQYVAMRALGDPDAFPSGDLGLRQALANGTGRRPTPRELDRIAETWRPWRAYAAMCLWRKLR
jgi:AraC family transcriptional regulator of adaptative response / DNA-3-methyladenine glycosylase II